jgi:hypothetical protein
MDMNSDNSAKHNRKAVETISVSILQIEPGLYLKSTTSFPEQDNTNIGLSLSILFTL